MRKLIKNFAGYISIKNAYTKEQEEQIEYALRITVFEALKMLCTILIFTLIGYRVEVIVAIGTMAIIKPFIGGYHEDSQVKCFISSVLIVGAIIYLSINLNVDFISKLILSLTALFCIWNQAPVVHAKMALTKEKLINRNRNVGLILTIIFIFISIAFHKYNATSNLILWVIVFHALFMFNKRSK